MWFMGLLDHCACVRGHACVCAGGWIDGWKISEVI